MSRLLKQLGHEVLVANPRKLRLIHKNRREDDRVDARYLARVAVISERERVQDRAGAPVDQSAGLRFSTPALLPGPDRLLRLIHQPMNRPAFRLDRAAPYQPINDRVEPTALAAVLDWSFSEKEGRRRLGDPASRPVETPRRVVSVAPLSPFLPSGFLDLSPVCRP